MRFSLTYPLYSKIRSTYSYRSSWLRAKEATRNVSSLTTHSIDLSGDAISLGGSQIGTIYLKRESTLRTKNRKYSSDYKYND